MLITVAGFSSILTEESVIIIVKLFMISWFVSSKDFFEKKKLKKAWFKWLKMA